MVPDRRAAMLRPQEVLLLADRRPPSAAPDNHPRQDELAHLARRLVPTALHKEVCKPWIACEVHADAVSVVFHGMVRVANAESVLEHSIHRVGAMEEPELNIFGRPTELVHDGLPVRDERHEGRLALPTLDLFHYCALGHCLIKVVAHRHALLGPGAELLAAGGLPRGGPMAWTTRLKHRFTRASGGAASALVRGRARQMLARLGPRTATGKRLA
mmetsp:Transcript_80546/g.224097  ORF Transcript_80546/g.224097 Transcript_80546/m.224097 type:complete len:215 (+) Transcript_80546:2159-2803(+)